jgi:MFS family permease
MFFGESVMATYYLSHGLTHAQIYSLQVLLALSLILSDMPFGHLADRIGGKYVIIFGTVVLLVQSSYFFLCTTYHEFQIALLLTGVYLGILRNSTDGIMTLSVAGCHEEYDAYLAKKSQILAISYAVSILAGGVMVAIGGLSIPYYAQPANSLLCLIWACRIVQPPRRAVARRKTLRKVARIMLVDRKDVRYLTLTFAVVSTTRLLCYWIIQPRLALAGIPTWMFAYIYVGMAAISWFGSKWVATMRAKYGDTRIWVYIIVTLSGGAVIAGLTRGFIGVVLLLLGLSSVVAFAYTLIGSFLKKALGDDYSTRNAELAVVSTLASVVFAVVAPVIGHVADRFSIGMAFVLIGATGFGLGYISFRAFQRASR